MIFARIQAILNFSQSSRSILKVLVMRSFFELDSLSRFSPSAFLFWIQFKIRFEYRSDHFGRTNIWRHALRVDRRGWRHAGERYFWIVVRPKTNKVGCRPFVDFGRSGLRRHRDFHIFEWIAAVAACHTSSKSFADSIQILFILFR